MMFCKSSPDKCGMCCDNRFVLMCEVLPNPVTDIDWRICFPVSEREHAEDLYRYIDTHEKFNGHWIVPGSVVLLYPWSECGADTSSTG